MLFPDTSHPALAAPAFLWLLAASGVALAGMVIACKIIIRKERSGHVRRAREKHEEYERALELKDREIAEGGRRLAESSVQMKMKKLELMKVLDTVGDATRLKSDFLATMSHEIRTPMNGIIGITELLLESGLTERQKTYTQSIMHSAEALLTIINDILDFSKIEAGRLDLELIPFSLHDIFDDVTELLAIKARSKDIELIVRFAPGTPDSLMGDPVRIRQIITNLTDNAIKFTEKGSVLVTVRPHDDTAMPGKTWIKVSVRDTGIGISKKAQANLFQKFSQVDASTTRQFGGTGLGLAICKQLTALMGGKIGVTSEEGEGSTFWFTMELALADSPVGNIGSTDISILRDVRALIVDDLDDNITLVREQLEAAGMECLSCNDSTKALGALIRAKEQGAPVQIALIDLAMPRMNGEMLARQIKTMDSHVQDTAIIILTSAGGQGLASRFAEIPVSAYLSKPIHSRALIDTVAHVWQAWQNGVRDGLVSAETIRTEIRAEDNVFFEGARILVVDDNSVNQAVAERLLQGLGCRITLAANGREAIELLRTAIFDLVFMDVHMPEMNGLEASRHITDMKHRGVVRDIPVIALTASVAKDELDICLEAGMQDYITKPVRKAELIQRLALWLPHMVTKPTTTLSPADNESREKPVPEKLFDKARVLLAEDNHVNREFAVEVLESLGCEVTTAANGKIAVQKARDGGFDLVLMDIQMPEMDGYEATRQLREMTRNDNIPRCPVIAVTANAMKGDREKCLEAGMDDYLSKPIKKKQLSEMLLRWLPESRRAPPGTGK